MQLQECEYCWFYKRRGGECKGDGGLTRHIVHSARVEISDGLLLLLLQLCCGCKGSRHECIKRDCVVKGNLSGEEIHVRRRVQCYRNSEKETCQAGKLLELMELEIETATALIMACSSLTCTTVPQSSQEPRRLIWCLKLLLGSSLNEDDAASFIIRMCIVQSGPNASYYHPSRSKLHSTSGFPRIFMAKL